MSTIRTMDEVSEYLYKVHGPYQDFPKDEDRRRCMFIQNRLLQESINRSLPVLGISVYPGSFTIVAKTDLNLYYLWWYPRNLYVDFPREPLVKIGSSEGRCVYNGSWKEDLPSELKVDVSSLLIKVSPLLEIYGKLTV